MASDRRPRALRAAARLLVAAALLAASAAGAQPRPETLAACAVCHGPDGNSRDPLIPSIAGQPKLFVENQLVLIREGLRDVPPMKDALAGMSDETIIALAIHFAAQKPAPAPVRADADKARRGEATARRALCGTCHLADYSGQNQVPRLAGQHEAYLLQAMKQFRDRPGPGRDTIMAASLYGLDDAALADLAHYLAGFRP